MSPERKQLYFNLFVAALEGGIGYWCKRVEYKPLNENGEDNIDNFSAIIQEYDGKARYTINIKTIQHGLNLIVNGKATFGGMPLNPNGRTYKIGHKLIKNTDTDFDASDADNIVQIGLFGDVVYG